MINWAKRQLETVLGKTVTGLIGIFLLGAFAMWNLPKWIITRDAFSDEMSSIYSQMVKGDKWQELKITELREDIWRRRLWDLEDKIDIQERPITIRQQNRLEEIKAELETLRKTEIELKEELKDE